jgi:hypothetical protein
VSEKAKLYEKMAAVMGDLTRVPKAGVNQDQKYSYATSEDIKQVIRQAMAKHKLALLIEMPEYEATEITSQRGSRGTRIRGRLVFTIADGETGESVERSLWNEATDWQDKAFNKLYTTGEKYFLINTFLISTGDEDDADSGPGEEIKEASQPKQVKPAKVQQPTLPGNGKKASDAMTEYWSSVKAYALTQDQGREILAQSGGDPVKALAALEGHSQPETTE